ncbi:TPA: DUF262 domain-containing protein [Pseudomonas putida]
MDYEVSLQTIAWINAQRNDEKLVISADFQRRAVWLERERAELISTIISGLPFPEIYVHVKTDMDSGKQIHVVVDGQQRTTSILKFIDNEFALPQNSPFPGQYFRDLTLEAKEGFWDYKVVVRSLRKTNDAEIRDIFARLNTNNITLNDQELRNAKYTGRFKQAAERLADNPLFEEMGLFTARDMRRMLDVEFVSELLLRLAIGITNKKDLLEEIYAICEEEFPGEAEYETEFTTAMSLIWSIYDESNKPSFKARGNFSSIFGCFVEYYRRTGKRSFERPAAVKQIFSEFLGAVRERKFDDDRKNVEIYHDAVSRASSDRARRARRENILSELLVESGEIDQALVH